VANNVGDLWELDLADMRSLASNKAGHSYILNAIDVFSKYDYLVLTRSKTEEAEATAFRITLDKAGGIKPLAV